METPVDVVRAVVAVLLDYAETRMTEVEKYEAIRAYLLGVNIVDDCVDCDCGDLDESATAWNPAGLPPTGVQDSEDAF
jgi:hypothetical protein